MYQDYRDLLSAFHAHGVKYLVVGGFAVIFHAQPRFTKEMDLFIKADLVNARAVYAALARFGASLQGIRPEDFADRSTFFRFGREPRGFDILPDIPGVNFDAAWERRVETVIDPRPASRPTSFQPKILLPRSWRLDDRRTLRMRTLFARLSRASEPAQKRFPEMTAPNR